MKTSKLDIWITERGDPCRISTIKQHFVYVLHCNGEVLEWCGKRYVALPTECGHLELDIPPGCYVVGAVEFNSGVRPFGNYLTHVAIVRANCGDEICVTLFDPSLHFCGTWIGAATNTYLAGGAGGQAIPRELAVAMQNVGAATARLVRALPADRFVEAQFKAIGQAPAQPRTVEAPPATTKGGSKKGRK